MSDVDISFYLCKGCNKPIDFGDEVVVLSDGVVEDEDERVAKIKNRRVYHADCWIDEKEALDGD